MTVSIQYLSETKSTATSLRHAVLDLCDAHRDFGWLTLIRGSSEQTHTLEDLRSRIADHCRAYRRRGLDEGDTVLIITRESVDLFAAFFAAITCGALPAYFAYPSPKQTQDAFFTSIRNLVDYNDIRLVVGYAQVVELLRSAEAVTGPGFLGYVSHEEIRPGRWQEIESIPEPAEEAFLQFSSGTTGAKKAVKITAEALFNQIRAYGQFVRYDESSKVVSWLPHYHDMGLIACMLMPFLGRVPICMMSPFEWVGRPAMLLEAITRHHCTHLWLPNFALGHLTRSVPAQDAARYDLSHIRRLVCCAEPVLRETVEHFVDRFKPSGLCEDAILNCYAMAENTFAVTSTRRGPIRVMGLDAAGRAQPPRSKPNPAHRTVVSAGTPLPNVRIRIVDAQGGHCPSGRTGEIWIQSDCLIDGYHNNPDATRAAFTRGWFRTGDLGFMHDGELYVTGRKKDLIIIGGENIYPQDIEEVLNRHPSLVPGRNVAFGADDPRVGTERIVVLAETRHPFNTVDTLELHRRIMESLRVPVSEFILLKPMTLRKSTAGKVSRALNKAAYLEGVFSEGGTSTTTGQDAEGLRDIVLSIRPGLRTGDIDPDTPLLSTGIIDSFDLATLIAALEETYDVRFPPAMRTTERFASLRTIEKSIQEFRGASESTPAACPRPRPDSQWSASLDRLENAPRGETRRPGWAEWCINRFPLRMPFVFRGLLRLVGVKVGRNVTFLGRVKVKLRGRPGNILIGDHAVLGDDVELRNRENGRIILRNKVYLDDGVRIVAAREGTVDIGIGTEVGRGTVINSGGDVTIGRFAMIAGGVNINASSHGTRPDQCIKAQPHSHGTVEIGDDVWIGSGASVIMNTSIGAGAVIASNSLVSGTIPPLAICAGLPAKVLRYR